MAVELDVRQRLLLPPGGGDVVRDTPQSRAEVLSDHEALNVTLFQLAGGRPGAELHVHRRHADAFYVVEGEITVPFGLAGEPARLTPGSFVLLPPLVVHGFRNDSALHARFLNIHAPGMGFTQRLRGRSEEPFDQEPPPEDGGRPRSDAVLGSVETIADRPGLSVALLADVPELGLVEVRARPDGGAPPLHIHRRHIECFYILAGELMLAFPDGEQHAAAGDWVLVPPEMPHTFSATGTGDARYLNFHAPSCGFGEFVRALHTARDDEELNDARARFDQVPA